MRWKKGRCSILLFQPSCTKGQMFVDAWMKGKTAGIHFLYSYPVLFFPKEIPVFFRRSTPGVKACAFNCSIAVLLREGFVFVARQGQRDEMEKRRFERADRLVGVEEFEGQLSIPAKVMPEVDGSGERAGKISRLKKRLRVDQVVRVRKLKGLVGPVQDTHLKPAFGGAVDGGARRGDDEREIGRVEILATPVFIGGSDDDAVQAEDEDVGVLVGDQGRARQPAVRNRDGRFQEVRVTHALFISDVDCGL